MLREFEQRLADVFGAGLPAPIAGAVDVAPGTANSQVLVSVRQADPVADDFLSQRPEIVPGTIAQRRVARLKCDVSIQVRSIQNQTRADQMSVFDSLLFFLDNPPFRSGRSLDGGAPDPGFFLQSLTLRTSEPPSLISLDGIGLFWPVGTPGETGQPIESVLTRMVSEPILLEPLTPRLIAGASAIDLVVRLGAANAMDIQEGDVTSRNFGDLFLRLTDAGGRPGGGTLSGGADGPNGSRRIAVVNGGVSFQYTPPAEPVTDLLHVSYDNAEIGVIELKVRSV
jgi:hypothetical protein